MEIYKHNLGGVSFSILCNCGKRTYLEDNLFKCACGKSINLPDKYTCNKCNYGDMILYHNYNSYMCNNCGFEIRLGNLMDFEKLKNLVQNVNLGDTDYFERKNELRDFLSNFFTNETRLSGLMGFIIPTIQNNSRNYFEDTFNLIKQQVVLELKRR